LFQIFIWRENSLVKDCRSRAQGRETSEQEGCWEQEKRHSAIEEIGIGVLVLGINVMGLI
jgi:hypothetical protein